MSNPLKFKKQFAQSILIKDLRMELLKKLSFFVAIVIIVVSAALFILGYRLVIDANATPDWNAIAAIGTCIIPIAVVLLEVSFTRKQRAIEQSNAKVLDELQEFRDKNKDAIEQLERFHSGKDTRIMNGGNASNC